MALTAYQRLAASLIESGQAQEQPQTNPEAPHCVVSEKVRFAAADDVAEWAQTKPLTAEQEQRIRWIAREEIKRMAHASNTRRN